MLPNWAWGKHNSLEEDTGKGKDTIKKFKKSFTTIWEYMIQKIMVSQVCQGKEGRQTKMDDDSQRQTKMPFTVEEEVINYLGLYRDNLI